MCFNRSLLNLFQINLAFLVVYIANLGLSFALNCFHASATLKSVYLDGVFDQIWKKKKENLLKVIVFYKCWSADERE